MKANVLAVFEPISEVVGVGITRRTDSYGVSVNLRQPPAAGVALPDSIEGVPVAIEIIGVIWKYPAATHQLDGTGPKNRPAATIDTSSDAYPARHAPIVLDRDVRASTYSVA